ncbi:histidinol-phosphate transaminase [Ferroplasma sp.]|uniref:histidinol-phosphate transaminase n=1 Tax=Ferroplasma sp. TaxID=2591003 RepID=UPI00307F985C
MEDIYLDKNENPFNIPEKIRKEFIKYIKEANFNRYPEKGLPELLNKLAGLTGFSSENLIAANGSDELLDMLIEHADGDIIISSPTFEMYSFYARNYGHRAIDIPLRPDFSINADEILKHKEAKLIVICSPNNPTGNLIDRSSMEKILDSGIATLLDNAYYEFSGEDYTDLLAKYKNLIILRTFSKAYSLAGMRIGYGIGNVEFISELRKLQAPFYMNILSAKIAEIMVDNYGLIGENIKYIVKERDRVYNEIKEMAYPSSANFLLLKKDLYAYMEERGIHIRKLPLLKDKSRITIGTEKENNRVIDAIKEYVKK